MPDDLPHYDLAPVERAILTIGPGMDREKMTLLLQLAQAAQQRAAAIVKLCKERMVEVIQAEGQFTVGGIRYYAGDETVTKCKAVPEAVAVLLERCGGDLGQFASLLASGALKPAACRAVLAPAEFAAFFETEVRPELREGKPVKKLLTHNPEFAKGGAR